MAATKDRGSFWPNGRASSPFLAIGLFLVIIVLGFNYWSATTTIRDLRLSSSQLSNKISFLEMRKRKLETEKNSLRVSEKEKEQYFEQEKMEHSKQTDHLATVTGQLNNLKSEVEGLKNTGDECQNKFNACSTDLQNSKADEEKISKLESELNQQKENNTHLSNALHDALMQLRSQRQAVLLQHQEQNNAANNAGQGHQTNLGQVFQARQPDQGGSNKPDQGGSNKEQNNQIQPIVQRLDQGQERQEGQGRSPQGQGHTQQGIQNEVLNQKLQTNVQNGNEQETIQKDNQVAHSDGGLVKNTLGIDDALNEQTGQENENAEDTKLSRQANTVINKNRPTHLLVARNSKQATLLQQIDARKKDFMNAHRTGGSVQLGARVNQNSRQQQIEKFKKMKELQKEEDNVNGA